MITWYEGEVLDYTDPAEGDTPVIRMTLRELTQNMTITDVQMHIKDNLQEKPKKRSATASGSIVAFYRDSAATAKFGFLLSDPRPIGSPIAIETAIQAAIENSLYFEEGEVALKATGSSDIVDATPGANLWLRNSGNGLLCSGTYKQRVVVSDESESVDIEGTNVDIYTHGNLLTTHGIHIDSDALGITSLSLGLKNTTTGVFLSRLKCDFSGAFSIGAPDPLTDSLVSGFSFTTVPSLPGTVSVPECKLTAAPLLSQLIVNPLGTTINGPTITLAGAAAVGAAPAPAAAVNILATTTNVTGAVTVEGISTVVGSSIVAGDVNIVGTVVGTPLISTEALPGSPLLSYLGVVVPAAGVTQLAAGITQKIPVVINGQPLFLLVGS